MRLSKEARKISKGLFRESFVDGRLDSQRVSLITRRLVEGKPRDLSTILKNYHHLLKGEIESHTAVVESAVALSPEEVEKVTAELTASHSGDLVTEFKINPDLIGGLRVRIGSNVWDGSVRDRLLRLQNSL